MCLRVWAVSQHLMTYLVMVVEVVWQRLVSHHCVGLL